MLIAEAGVATERSGRYLVQLCSHIDLVARSHPQMQATAKWSDDRGVINFGSSRCGLRAEPGLLWLRAEAPDAESLHQLKARIADRLANIGRRDGLTVTWTSLPSSAPGASPELRPDPTVTSKGHNNE